MKNQWFRMYSEFATDPKVQSLPEAMQRRLVMLFCLQCDGSLHTLDDDELAFALHLDSEELGKTKASFARKGFINDSWEILNWDKRQFVSDSSNSRVAKYREKRKLMGLTSNGYIKHSDTVMARDCHECVYCGSKEKLCIDHVKPVTSGGNDDLENLVCACKACNSGKSGRTPDQAGYSFKNKKTEKIYRSWESRNNVTVTVTPPDTDTDTDTERDDDYKRAEEKKPEIVTAEKNSLSILEFQKISERLQEIIKPGLPVNTQRVYRWVYEGATPELIEMTIQCVMARFNGGSPPTSLKYFDKPIADAIASKNKPLPEGTQKNERTANRYGKMQSDIIEGLFGADASAVC